MINGQAIEMRIPPHALSIPDNDDTNDEKHPRDSATTKVTRSRYYESAQKSGDDDLDLLPITSEPMGTDWTTGPRGAIISFLFMITCSGVLIFGMNFVHQRMPLNAPPLPDLGHELIPKMEPEKLGDMTMMIMILFLLIAVITNRDRWPIMIRFFMTLAYLYLLRVVSILSTSMPPTENHCRFNFQKIDNIYYNTFKGIITLGSSNMHCGDLMFSGHTCMIANVWMTFQINYKRKYLLRIITTVLLITTMIFIIGTRSHYSVDVWIAFWLTVLIHKSAPRRFPFTKEKIRKYLRNI